MRWRSRSPSVSPESLLVPLGVGVDYGVLRRPERLVLFRHVTATLPVAAVVFDVKDIEGDGEAGIRTLPTVVALVVVGLDALPALLSG